MTIQQQVPTYPPGGLYSAPVPSVGAVHVPDAGTSYERLPRTLRWAWWRPLLALGIFGVAFLIAQGVIMAIGFGLALLTGAVELSEAGAYAWLDSLLELDAADPLALGVSLASLAVMIPTLMLALRWSGLRPVGHVSSVALRLRWGWLRSCLALAAATMLLSLGLSLLLGALAGEPLEPVWTPWQRFVPALLVILALVPFQAAAEEYVFRGVFVQWLGSWLPKRWWGRLIVWVVPTALFVAGHLYDVWGLTDVGLFALAAMWLTLRTGGLEAAIALHVLNNLMAFTLLASGLFGTTVNGASGGTLAGVLTTAVTSIVYCWAVEARSRRAGIERRSSWPEVGSSGSAPVPVPFSGAVGPVYPGLH